MGPVGFVESGEKSPPSLALAAGLELSDGVTLTSSALKSSCDDDMAARTYWWKGPQIAGAVPGASRDTSVSDEAGGLEAALERRSLVRDSAISMLSDSRRFSLASTDTQSSDEDGTFARLDRFGVNGGTAAGAAAGAAAERMADPHAGAGRLTDVAGKPTWQPASMQHKDQMRRRPCAGKVHPRSQCSLAQEQLLELQEHDQQQLHDQGRDAASDAAAAELPPSSRYEPGVRYHTDPTPARLLPMLWWEGLALFSLVGYMALPLHFCIVAVCAFTFSWPAVFVGTATLATLLVPARPLLWEPFLHFAFLRSIRAYFDFSVTLERPAVLEERAIWAGEGPPGWVYGERLGAAPRRLAIIALGWASAPNSRFVIPRLLIPSQPTFPSPRVPPRRLPPVPAAGREPRPQAVARPAPAQRLRVRPLQGAHLAPHAGVAGHAAGDAARVCQGAAGERLGQGQPRCAGLRVCEGRGCIGRAPLVVRLQRCTRSNRRSRAALPSLLRLSFCRSYRPPSHPPTPPPPQVASPRCTCSSSAPR
jgi:hypothetical protein